MKKLICPSCNHRGPSECFLPEPKAEASKQQIDRLCKAAEQINISPLPGDFFSESDTAKIIGLSASALRKRAEEGRSEIDFVCRGSRRFYPLEQIALFF